MLLPKRSVTLIIQLTVHKAKLAKQLPHCLVVPIKDREYTHERGPPLTAWLYFFQILGFNSTFAKGSAGNGENLFFDLRNQYQVSFRYYLYASEYATYWSGTKANFSSKNATQIYTLIKQQKFD